MPKPFQKIRPPVGPQRAALAVSLTALLAGCTVGPDFVPPDAPKQQAYTAETVDLPKAAGNEAEQRLALGQKISGGWWQLFRSPQLDGVLQRALTDNQNLAAAKATLAQARDSVDQATGGLFPRVQLTGGASRQHPNPASQGIQQPGSTFNLYSIGPNVSYALDLFGGNKRNVEQQEALAEYQDYQLNAAYLTLTGGVVTQAITIASAREQIKAVREIIADDEKNLNLVGSELAVGAATRAEVESARSQLAADRTQLPPLRQQLNVARHALAILVGQAPSEWSAPDFDLGAFGLPDELPVSLPSELVHQRPDLLAAEAQLHAASAAIGVATAQLYPNITLSASFAQQALRPENMFMGASSIWSLAANLAAPIFDGGALAAQRQGAVDAFQVKLATYKQTVLQSFGQVADVLQALENDAALLDEQQRAVQSARTSLDLARASYSAGDVKVLQVIDAERLYEQARLGYIRAKAQRHIDTAQLFGAMGGGWWDWRAQADAGPGAAATSAKM
jgi:NodT family efflux transporter outer membrane factor (OMF) lipoprotein